MRAHTIIVRELGILISGHALVEMQQWRARAEQLEGKEFHTAALLLDARELAVAQNDAGVVQGPSYRQRDQRADLSESAERASDAMWIDDVGAQHHDLELP